MVGTEDCSERSLRRRQVHGVQIAGETCKDSLTRFLFCSGRHHKGSPCSPFTNDDDWAWDATCLRKIRHSERSHCGGHGLSSVSLHLSVRRRYSCGCCAGSNDRSRKSKHRAAIRGRVVLRNFLGLADRPAGRKLCSQIVAPKLLCACSHANRAKLAERLGHPHTSVDFLRLGYKLYYTTQLV